MSQIKTFKCDAKNCTSIKQEANHWWIVINSVVEPYSYIVQLFPLSEDLAGALGEDQQVNHVCSESCLLKVEASIRNSWTIKLANP